MSAKDATGAAIQADRLYGALTGMSVEGVGEFPQGTTLRGSHPALAVAGVCSRRSVWMTASEGS